MSEARLLTGLAALGCGLAFLGSLDPRIDAVISTLMLIALVLGVVAGGVAYVVHIHRVRRDIERGEGMRWVKDVDPTATHRPGELRAPPRRDPVDGAGPRPQPRPPRRPRKRRPAQRSSR
jgi:hypothetical protein